MSCYNLVNINNPSLHWSHGMPFRFGVPCGHCPECRKAKRNDWYVRSIYEYEYQQKNGAFSVFETLTYNPTFRPHHFGINHFDRSHIRLFFQRLKSFIKDLDPKFTFSNPDNYISYLITCEYGASPHHQHLPHYHCIFHVHVHGLDYRDFLRCVQKAWKYGFSNPINRTVKDSSGKYHYYRASDWLIQDTTRLAYVTKYVSKSLDFITDFNKVLDGVHTQKNHKEIIKKITRKLSPFIAASQGYGISGVDHYNGAISSHNLRYDSSRGYIVKVVPTKDGDTSLKFRIPLYIQTKLFKRLVYEVREDGQKHPVYYYNELGIKLKTNYNEQITNSVRTLQNRLADYCSIIDTFKTSEEFGSRCKSAAWRVQALDTLLQGRLTDFVVYYNLYHHTFIDDSVDLSNPAEILRSRYSVNETNYINPQNVSNYGSLDFQASVNNGEIPIFDQFPQAAQLMDDINDLLQPLKHQLVDEKDRLQNHLDQLRRGYFEV